MISVPQIKARVAAAWFALEKACDTSRSDVSQWLREAELTALRGEREHRAMGARFTHGQASYRVPCAVAARAIILHHVYFGYAPAETAAGRVARKARKVSWSDVASTRRDCALAYAIRECLTPAQIHELSAAAEIDYSRDIAGGA